MPHGPGDRDREDPAASFDGPMTANSGAPTTGRVLAGRYRLGSRRGAGLDIAIFEAFDEQLGRQVAVRLVHPDI